MAPILENYPFLHSLFSLLLTALKLTTIAVLIFMVLLFFGQRYMLFPAPKNPLPHPLPNGVSLIELEQGYGLLLNAARHEHDRRPLIIFAHGNAEAAHFWLDEFDWALQRGISVLLLEYPGYAEAPGSPSFDSLQTNVLAAYDTLIQRDDIDPQQIIGYGRSIGSAPMGLLAQQRPLAAVVFESGLASLVQLVYDHRYPGFLVRDRFDNRPIVAELEVPLFLYHGHLDRVIPVHHAHTLRDLAKDVSYHEVACDHNNCPRPWPLLIKFLENRTNIPLLTPALGETG